MTVLVMLAHIPAQIQLPLMLSLDEAHEHASNNQQEIRQSQKCGCFYCLGIFGPDEIEQWINEKGGMTAICPRCSIDSVIGDASGFSLSIEFLQGLHTQWFEKTRSVGTVAVKIGS